MEQVIFAGSSQNISPFGDSYGYPLGDLFGIGPETQIRRVISTDGKFKSLRVKLSVAPGATKHWDVTLVLNGAPSLLTCEIADTATSGSDMVNEVVVTGGDTVSILYSPDNSPANTKVFLSMIFEGDNANESLIMGGTNVTLEPGATEYGQVMSARTEISATEDNYRQVVPTGGTIKDLYVSLTLDPGTDPDAYKFTLRKGGISQTLTVTITADATTGNDLVNSFAVVAGDILTLMIEPLNTPSGTPYATWGMTFVATVDKESIVLGGSTDLMEETVTYYNQLLCGETKPWTGTQSNRYQIGQGCTLTKLYILLDAAPGAGKDYTFTVRIAGAASNVVAIVADAATTGNSGALTDTMDLDEYVALASAPTAGPDNVAAYWGLISFRDISLPTVTTQVASSVQATSAIGNGNITNIDAESCFFRGVVWDTVTRGDPGNVDPATSAYTNYALDAGVFGVGAYTIGMTGLLPETDYFYRACAANGAGWDYGDEQTFRTPEAGAGGLRMILSLKGHMGYDMKTREGKARRRMW